jgi:hypothetical protein
MVPSSSTLHRLEGLVAELAGVGGERRDGVEHQLVELCRLFGRHVGTVGVVARSCPTVTSPERCAVSLMVIWATMPEASWPGTVQTPRRCPERGSDRSSMAVSPWVSTGVNRSVPDPQVVLGRADVGHVEHGADRDLVGHVMANSLSSARTWTI